MDSDEVFVALAERQHGAVGRWQLREAGVHRAVVARRLTQGRWDLAADGRVVRLVGAPATAEQQAMIAVLARGPNAAASHVAAGWVWQLPGFSVSTDVSGVRHEYGGPTSHRPRLWLPEHRTVIRGIPVTTLPKTLFDLAAVLPLGRLARLLDVVVTKSPAMLPALHRMLPDVAVRGRPGITSMRTLLAERPVGARVPASGNERRFEAICHHAGIRGFERQIDVGGHSWIGRADYRNARLRLIVEVDSILHHTSVTDVADDKARDAAMLAAGWRKVVRIWDEDLWQRPWEVVETLLGAIAELEARAA